MNFSADSNTLIILLHEIYGINEHMQTVAAEYSKAGFNVICPDLLGLGRPFEYSQQQEAYRYFTANVGFEKAADQVKELATDAKRTYNNVFLTGYSIGATIAWLCSNERNMFNSVIGYYGSRIRDYTAVEPKCPVLLFFPAHEKSFDVRSFVCSFKKTNVEIHMLNGEHGFADPFSQNYCDAAFKQSVNIVHNFFQNKILLFK